jgi:threonyl-tRNA synthetase
MFEFLSAVYGKFGFTFKMKLSTRPEKFLGEIETWDKAEARLKEALDAFNGTGESFKQSVRTFSSANEWSRWLGA